MLRKMMTIALAALLAALALTTTGCRAVRIADSPRVTNESRSVPLAGAGSIEARVRMAVGELRLSSEETSTDALKAEFTYSPQTWKPETSYVLESGTGRLEVRQPESVEAPSFGDTQNKWDLVFAGGIPTTLDLQLGVGKSTLDLRGVDLQNMRQIGLHVVCGVGDTTIDLGRRPTARDLSVTVETGVGKTVIRLPRGQGVRVDGRQDGVGDMTADGFIAQGNTWVNEAYAGSGPKIEIVLTRGIGDVALVLVD